MNFKKPSIQIAVLTVFVWMAFSHVALAEKINSFDAEITIQDTGSFVVTETIVYDFEGVERRGIFRNISNHHAQSATAWYKTRFINLELISVTKDGQPEPYTIQDYDGLSVRIGDPDVYITGAHTYEITYQVDGAIAMYPELNELYWNVTGNEWEVPIEKSHVVLMAPVTLFDLQRSCYLGNSSESEECAHATQTSPTTIEFTSGYIAPGQEFTIAQALILPQKPEIIERISVVWIFFVLPLIFFFGLLLYVYRWRTYFKTHASIIPQYEPLSDFKPMLTGVLFDNKLNARDISAGIVYLAEQGFISIRETEEKVLMFFEVNDYEVTLLRPTAETQTDFHQTLLLLLFSVADQPGATMKLSKLKSDTRKQRTNAEALRKLEAAAKKDLTQGGYWEIRFFNGLTVKKVILSAIGSILFFVIIAQISVPLAVLFVLVIIILLQSYRRRTKKGYEALDYLKGFKEFLSVTEKDRYKFHNAPSKSPEQFMEYLPYAIAFGVEKEWATVFKDISIANPDWYQGSNSSTFNAVVFSQTLSSFTNSFASSSGSSGSSGGGSAGGGSGGGGGGSW